MQGTTNLNEDFVIMQQENIYCILKPRFIICCTLGYDVEPVLMKATITFRHII